jgi:hypothetical protein
MRDSISVLDYPDKYTMATPMKRWTAMGVHVENRNVE